LFENAIGASEPALLEAYAGLVKRVRQTFQGYPKKFTALIIAKCKAEFYTNSKSLKVGENGGGGDQLTHLGRAHRRKLGNMRFTCELYKLGILPHEALVVWIQYLLNSPNEENFALVCEMLTIVGHKLETKAASKWMNKIFRKLKTQSKGRHLSTSTRLAVDAVFKLRQNQWKQEGSREPLPLPPSQGQTSSTKRKETVDDVRIGASGYPAYCWMEPIN